MSLFEEARENPPTRVGFVQTFLTFNYCNRIRAICVISDWGADGEELIKAPDEVQSDWFELVLNGTIVGTFGLGSSLQMEASGSQIKPAVFPTQVLDGVIALLVVHFDGLRMRTADAIADAVAAHHDVLVLRRRPAHHDAVDQWAHVQRTGLVGNAGFWGGRGGFQWDTK